MSEPNKPAGPWIEPDEPAYPWSDDYSGVSQRLYLIAAALPAAIERTGHTTVAHSFDRSAEAAAEYAIAVADKVIEKLSE